MSIDLLYKTTTMLVAMSQMEPRKTFLRDRYFPTDPSSDIFSTEDVLMDIRDGEQKMAPVILPRKKAVTVAREGYKTDRMTPPYVAPQRILTLDDLNARGFGEALHSDKSPEEREAALLGKDLDELDRMHSNREEYIAAKCMIGNGYILPQYADQYGTDEQIPYEIQFYDGADNPGRFTPAIPWDGSGADIFADLGAMVRVLTLKGKPVSDLIAGPDVIDAIIDDNKIYKLLDNRRMEFGYFDPKELPEGASFFGSINIAGRRISIFSYEAQFRDDITGEVAPVFAPGDIVLTAPGSGRGLYGAVSQIEQADGKVHTYTATRVPKYLSDADNDIRTLRLVSRPLFAPRYANPWVGANVFT